jgi:hypothetical protein
LGFWCLSFGLQSPAAFIWQRIGSGNAEALSATMTTALSGLSTTDYCSGKRKYIASQRLYLAGAVYDDVIKARISLHFVQQTISGLSIVSLGEAKLYEHAIINRPSCCIN